MNFAKNSSFLQSKTWNAIKKKTGLNILETTDFFLQIKKIPFLNINLGYLPRIKIQESTLKTLKTLKDIDLMQIEPSIADSNEFLELPLAKDVQLKHTVYFDLNEDLNIIFAKMPSKTRYNINLAKRKNIFTKFGNDKNLLKDFFKVYLDTKNRKKYLGRNTEYIKEIFTESEKENSDIKILLAVSYLENMPVVGWFILLYKDTAFLPYAGSNSEYLNTKATYKILFDTLEYLKEAGFKTFDFYGILDSDLKNDGFSSYKKSFGGNIFKYPDSRFLILKNNFKVKIFLLVLKYRERFNFLKKFL